MNKRMKEAIAVIGEGITEYYYFNSVKDEYRQLNLKPSYPKHSSSLKDLEKEIVKAINMEYSLIFCVVDMDNKKGGKERQSYENLKRRFQGTHNVKRTGYKYEIRFIETERCTELFFLFYFAYTSKSYGNQTELLNELNKNCTYDKSEKFFRSHALHQYFQQNGGDFMQALRNAAKSMKEKEETGRDYTYSQMAQLFDALGIKTI